MAAYWGSLPYKNRSSSVNRLIRTKREPVAHVNSIVNLKAPSSKGVSFGLQKRLSSKGENIRFQQLPKEHGVPEKNVVSDRRACDPFRRILLEVFEVLQQAFASWRSHGARL